MTLTATEWLEAQSSPALLLDSSGVILAANTAAARLVGRPQTELVSANLDSLVGESTERVRDYLKLCSRMREPVPGAFTWQASNGKSRGIRTEGTVVRPLSKQGPAVVLIRCRDQNDAAEQFLLLDEKIKALSREIVARRRTEDERDELLASERAARQEAERTGRIKDEFLATLSHELRTPLNAILGWTQILQMTPPSPQDLKDGLAVIERNTRIQTQLIEDLLDMSRIISGKLRLEVQRVELAAVLEAAIESITPAFAGKNIRLHKVLDSAGAFIMGDPNRLQQIFWNLLSNAVKYTPKGGRVQVLLERVNSHVDVSIIDTGDGIKPEFLPHVFDRFQQADSSTTRQYGGLGLGLVIVRHLVELHGGTVRAKSPGEGQGATFIVTLPVTILHDEHHQEDQRLAKAALPPEMECPPAMSGLTVLVVDDEPDSLAMVARVLRTCGCMVFTAGNASDALNVLKQERPSVLVSDIGMPKEDGYSLLKRVRSLPASEGGATPAIALTAFARSEDRRRAILAGFQMHIAKPAESAELIAVVASVAGLTLPSE